MLVDVADTRLHVVERGEGLPLIALHGGPGLDHTTFGTALDGLGVRLLLVDQRAQGRSDPAPPESWTIARMARDVGDLAAALGLERYAVLGHSYGAMVALQHAVDAPRGPVATVISSGVASSSALMPFVEAQLAAFEPVELREQVTASWAAEAEARTQADCAALLRDQLPFHFADPRDERIEAMLADMADAVYAPDVLRAGATTDYGGIKVVDRLGEIAHPVLVVAGRHDRTCSAAAGEQIAAGVPGAELEVLERSGHMGFVEEPGAYVARVGDFLARADAARSASR